MHSRRRGLTNLSMTESEHPDSQQRLRKFLVVVDQTPESLKALRFAARRAQRTSGAVSMLSVIEPEEFQHWQSVQDAMRAEAIQNAEARLQALVEEVKALSGVSPDYAIREGVKRDQVAEHIQADRDISILVLGASTESDGPGPLVAAITRPGSRFPLPVTIVPGDMSVEEIDALC